MKRIFLIGDSIRIGYDSIVREMMAGEALFYWSEENARFAAHTLRYAHEWAKKDCDPEKVDIVHWNNGLWDALHILGDDAQTPVQEYAAVIRRVARRIRKVFPHARIIFALTTSVIEERMSDQFFRRNAEIEAYNAAARSVMAEEEIEINDLYTVAREMPDDWHAPDGTHFTEEGYRALAEAVVKALKG